MFSNIRSVLCFKTCFVSKLVLVYFCFLKKRCVMDQNHVREFLKVTVLGRDLPDEIIAQILANSTVKEIRPGMVLVKKGDPLTHLFLVIEGELHVRLFKSSLKSGNKGSIYKYSLTISKARKGQLLGDAGMVEESDLVWKHNIVVFELSKILILDLKTFEYLLKNKKNSQLVLNIVKLSLIQLRNIQTRSFDIVGVEVAELIYRELYELAKIGHKSNDQKNPGWIIYLPTHQVLSEIIGTSRETVSIRLKILKNKKKIVYLRNKHRAPILITEAFFEELRSLFEGG